MIRIFATVILVLFFVLLPPAVLAFVSQDALPGTTLYPVKRKLEDGILLIASVNPVTRAWFALAYSQRRYKETTALIAQGKTGDVGVTLNDLVDQTSLVADQIGEVKSGQQKKELVTTLKSQIKEYNQGLNQAKLTLERQTGSSGGTTRQPTPRPTVGSGGTSPTAAPTTTPPPQTQPDSNTQLQNQLDDAISKLDDIGDKLDEKEDESIPPPSDSTLDDSLLELDNLDINGLSNVLNSTISKYGSILGQ